MSPLASIDRSGEESREVGSSNLADFSQTMISGSASQLPRTSTTRTRRETERSLARGDWSLSVRRLPSFIGYSCPTRLQRGRVARRALFPASELPTKDVASTGSGVPIPQAQGNNPGGNDQGSNEKMTGQSHAKFKVIMARRMEEQHNPPETHLNSAEEANMTSNHIHG
ncbi:hypothetical protein BDV96DRAFT_235166 [Lophiotrema nucula]|uniref:Uncharacterized protein n=1 Tax=Lophiotrema nucula TaxID=690887 RepID=A0A6A5YTH1_9PLEO|nr:hypothetical protein BDV96DRAFT_235166 [Lophiotrema nucula]